MNNRIFEFFSTLFLRFYGEIIAGVWAILAFIPFDSYLYETLEGEPSYRIDIWYWGFFAIYTCFFLFSAALVPYFKEWKVNTELKKLLNQHRITLAQKNKIQFVIKDVLIYKSILTTEGFLQFLMGNIFCIGIILAYFGIEGFIGNLMFGKTLVIPGIFIILFFILLTVESFLDDYLAQKIKKSQTAKHIKGLYGQNKSVLMIILKNLGSGGSLSSNLSQMIIEDAIDDICEILHISSSTEQAKKRIEKPKKIGHYIRTKLKGDKVLKIKTGKKPRNQRYRNKTTKPRRTTYSNY